MKRLSKWILALVIGSLLVLFPGAKDPSSCGLSRAYAETISLSTLEDEAVLSGSAAPNAPFSLVVYNHNYGGDERILYQTEGTVPKGGFYQITAPLPVLGVQYVEFTLEGALRVYEYTRYDRNLPKQLSAYYLNIYEFLN